MIVEDEPAARDRYVQYVDSHDQGFRVVAACENATDALERLSSAHPDVLLTDIRMPGRSGLDLIASIRAAGWNGYGVIISGYEEFHYAQDAIRLGVYDYLLKPVFPDDMAALLERIQRDGFPPEPGLTSSLLPDVELSSLPSFVTRAIAHVQRYHDTPLSLADAAAAVAVSPAHLSSSFPRFLGVRYVEFLQMVRVESAKTLLRTADATIEDIAARIGFEDPSYFFRVFKRVTGMTPGEYRAAVEPS